MKKTKYYTNNPTDVEEIPEQESAWRSEIAAITVKLQEMRKSLQNGEVLRGVHPKSHGCIDADFIVNEDLRGDYRIGLFAHPGKRFKAKIRYSNAAVVIERDLGKKGENGSRGMAIKVLDVGDPVLLEDDGARNQDFLMVNTPEFAFANARDYRRLSLALLADKAGAGTNPALFFLPLKLAGMGILGPTGKLNPPAPDEPAEITGMRLAFEHSGVFDGFVPEDLARTKHSFEIVKKIQGIPVRNPLQVQYFSAAPFRYGPHRVMKYSVAPVDGAVPQAGFSQEEADTIDENYLARALKESMAQGKEIRLSFKVQVVKASQLKDRASEMIEDASIAWSEEEFPFIEVARIVIHPKGQNGPLVDACKSLHFTPWHGLAEHEPLGGINRLRKPVYIESEKNRRGGAYAS